MAQRDGSVFLTLFIVMFVLFAIMTALFIQSNSEVTNLQGQLRSKDREAEEFRANNQKLSSQAADFRALIGGETYRDGEAWPTNEHFRQQLKDKVETAINASLKELGMNAREYTNLVEPYEDIPAILRKYSEGITKADADRRAAVDTQAQLSVQTSETVNTLQGRTSELLSQIATRESELEDVQGKAQDREQELLAQIEEIKDQWSDEVIDCRRKSNFKDNQLRSLRTRIQKLEEEVRKEQGLDDVEPDASILAVSNETGKAWVDVGRKDHLRKGLIFRVFQYVKGGKRLYKGRVEIRKPGEDMSEVRVVEEVDPLNPITTGDFISSPFYDPEAQPIFVFAGTNLASKDVTREFLESQMRFYGAVIDSKVDLNTDYLVATQNYENSEEYQRARELGVTVIREGDLLQFIGL